MYRYTVPFLVVPLIISHFLHGLCNLASNPGRASKVPYVMRGITRHIRTFAYGKNVNRATQHNCLHLKSKEHRMYHKLLSNVVPEARPKEREVYMPIVLEHLAENNVTSIRTFRYISILAVA
jgi:hypothetical protein